MSDGEDDIDILDDIKALEYALALESTFLGQKNEEKSDDDSNAQEHNLSFEDTNSPESISENTPDDLYSSVDAVLDANTRLIETYQLALNSVNNQLDECIKRQQEVDYQIHLISRGGRANWRVPYYIAGQPYFKDENFFRATPNDDILIKYKRDEFAIVYSRMPSVWSSKGRMNLWKAARANASLKYLEMMKSMNRNQETGSSDMDYLIPSDFTEILTTLGETELDWMRISVKDMKSRYSWQACKAMWDLHMKPTINREKWTTDEDNKLTSLAKLNMHENWDIIAEKLGTRRTCYQCFVRYNTINPPSIANGNSDVAWSSLENKLVIKLVEQLRIGDMVPWTLVTFYLGTRTKNQIYCHWKYNLDPTLKKGRFTPEEDQILLSAINRYGTNFQRIVTEYLPHRSTVQLSNRFHLLMLKTNESYNSWTIQDDKRLLALYDEFGNNWSIIGNIMNKDRTYVRHHHAALTRYLSKGIELSHLPRKQNSTAINDTDTFDSSDIELRVNENVDIQLMRYFHNVRAPTAGPGRKRKYHTPEQLETKTKQLHDIFKKLNVKINIPDNLDDIDGLTTMDKQLLISLKQSNYTSPKYTPDQIEEYRRKMFCVKFNDNAHDDDDNDNNESENFIPPAPFGLFQNIRKRKCPRIQGETVCNNCNLELIMEFETPKNIIDMMDHDEVKMFDKFSSLITQICKVPKYSRTLDCANINRLKNPCNIQSKHLNLQAGTSYSLSTNDESINTINNVFIKPYHSTLLGYQCLLNIQKTINKQILENLSINQNISKEDKKALSLFKNRLLALFKYPIGMARIPIDYKDNNDNDDDDSDNDQDENIDEDNLVKSTRQNTPGNSVVETQVECDEIIPGDIEVSMPVKLCLNMIKTLQKTKKSKNS